MKKFAAVIGYGGMGGWHTRHMLDSDVCALAGIYDINPQKNALAEERGIHAYASEAELLADPRIEFVTIATPNDVHEPIAIRAMEAGKSVICEKPVTLSMESLERMIDAAHKNHVLFSVHQNRRWDQDFLAMKQIVESGEIGEAINIESRIHGSRGIPGDWRSLKPYGGGMLYDWGVHLIDQALCIFGFDNIKSVRCDFDTITTQEVDDGFRLTITFTDGKQAYVEVQTLNFVAMPRFYLRCKKGTAIIRDWQQPTEIVKCKAWHESEVIPVQTAAGLTKTMAPRDSITIDKYELPIPKSDVHEYYRNFVKAMDGKETQLVTHDQIRTVLKVIMTAFESVEKGETIYW